MKYKILITLFLLFTMFCFGEDRPKTDTFRISFLFGLAPNTVTNMPYNGQYAPSWGLGLGKDIKDTPFSWSASVMTNNSITLGIGVGF